MKILNEYLPQDVSNIILDYLYKPDVKKLNKEYHSRIVYTNNCLYLYTSLVDRKMYQYREPLKFFPNIFNIHVIVVGKLSDNY